MASREIVSKVIGALAHFFPSFVRRQSDEDWTAMISAYHLVLADVDAHLLDRAAQDIVSRATFFPSAGELRTAAFDLADHDLPTAQDAWAEVSRRLRTASYRLNDRGFYTRRCPTADDWSHPLIPRAIKGIGGWRALTDPQAYAPADRARFIEAFDKYAARERRNRAMLPAVREAVERIRAGAPIGQPLALPAIIAGVTERGVPILELEPA